MTTRTGSTAQNVHITPGFRPWKQTFIRSTTDSTQHGDADWPRIGNDGGSSWKRLRSSDDDDDDDADMTTKSSLYFTLLTFL